MYKSDIRQQMLSLFQLGNLRSKTIEVLNLHVVDGKNNDTRKEKNKKAVSIVELHPGNYIFL